MAEWSGSDAVNDNRVVTQCRHIGAVCPHARLAVQRLDLLARKARRDSEDFEMSGEMELRGCAQGCTGKYRLTRDRAEIFCGVPRETAASDLSDFARQFLRSGQGQPLSLRCPPPAAFVAQGASLGRTVIRPAARPS